ncbi:DUF6457 domain-containing protein [Corynebacterium kalidii]
MNQSSNPSSTSRKGSPDEMVSAHAWLSQVAEELGLPADIARQSVRDVLELTAAVAHNRSRPAAPVTAFLIGLAAGQAAGQTAERQAPGENVSGDDLFSAARPRIERITARALDGISEHP